MPMMLANNLCIGFSCLRSCDRICANLKVFNTHANVLYVRETQLLPTLITFVSPFLLHLLVGVDVMKTTYPGMLPIHKLDHSAVVFNLQLYGVVEHFL